MWRLLLAIGCFLLRNLDLNFVAFDSQRKLIDLQSRVVAPGSVTDIEPPCVPGANDGALFV